MSIHGVSTQGGTFPGLWNRKRPGNASLLLGGSRLRDSKGHAVRYPKVVRGFHPPSPGRASPCTHQGVTSLDPRFCTLRVFFWFCCVSQLRWIPDSSRARQNRFSL